MSLHDEHLIQPYMGRSYSIKFKGTPQKEGSKFVKITMIFYRNGYNNRPSKVLNITGLIKEWDTKTELFKPNSSDNIDKNKKLLGIKQKYTRAVENWEENSMEWTPTQLATYFDIQRDSRSSQPIIQNVDKSIDKVIEMVRNPEES